MSNNNANNRHSAAGDPTGVDHDLMVMADTVIERLQKRSSCGCSKEWSLCFTSIQRAHHRDPFKDLEFAQSLAVMARIAAVRPEVFIAKGEHFALYIGLMEQGMKAGLPEIFEEWPESWRCTPRHLPEREWPQTGYSSAKFLDLLGTAVQNLHFFTWRFDRWSVFGHVPQAFAVKAARNISLVEGDYGGRFIRLRAMQFVLEQVWQLGADNKRVKKLLVKLREVMQEEAMLPLVHRLAIKVAGSDFSRSTLEQWLCDQLPSAGYCIAPLVEYKPPRGRARLQVRRTGGLVITHDDDYILFEYKNEECHQREGVHVLAPINPSGRCKEVPGLRIYYRYLHPVAPLPQAYLEDQSYARYCD